jgi:hypothetical protein
MNRAPWCGTFAYQALEVFHPEEHEGHEELIVRVDGARSFVFFVV